MPAQSFEASVLVASPQAADIFLLTVYLPPQCEKPKAGQFYMLRAWAADEPPLLSRPISVHHYEEGTRALSFLFQGTRKLAALRQGDTLQLTGPAGNGFALEGEKVALVGGGIGTAAGLSRRALPPCPLRGRRAQGAHCHRYRQLWAPRLCDRAAAAAEL